MNDTMVSPLGGTILIADDDANARLWLNRVLRQEGYTVEEAEDGGQALDMFERIRPDVVLLDAVMPGLDGFEVCAQLRTLPGGERTPILIITGLEGEDAVERAFEVGAVDYITKPIHWAVLRHRVRNLLRTRQLETMRDDLTQMIVHDMKNPISLIRGYSDMLLQDQSAGEWRKDALLRIFQSSNKLLDMTMMILDIGRLEEGKLTLQRGPGSALQALQEVKEGFSLMERDRHIRIEIDSASKDVIADMDWGMIQRVLTNLVSNAFKHSPEQSTISLLCGSIERSERYLMFSVADQGEGIPAQDQARIFDKFTQVASRTRGSGIDTGLGLTFCKLAAEAHGGTIELQSEVGAGSKFTLLLPY
jgi:signal transduction histidine kinase